MKTKIFFAVLLLAFSTGMMADKSLTITYSNTEQNISLPIVKRIFFQDDCIKVTTTNGETHSFALSGLEKITFTDSPDAIKALPEQEENLTYKDGTLAVKGDGLLRIHSMNGALVSIAQVKEGANISLDNLPAGVYVVNMNGKAIKVRK
ncbi:MAG: T9SS type A sorting domain-containing protein [Bacteroidaceae bacterium]|nr:T9SS type A sorting domain-containing protein [Bacteroidaceae bacterium]